MASQAARFGYAPRPMKPTSSTTIFALAAILLVASPAAANPVERLDQAEASTAGRLGVGVEAMLLEPFAPGGSLGVVYDAGALRVDGLLSLLFQEGGAVNFGLGARLLFPVHKTRRADFSIGPGLGISHNSHSPRGGGNTRVQVEGVAQIRFLIVDNVALHSSLGLGVGFGDGGFQFGLGGQLSGTMGLTYFF